MLKLVSFLRHRSSARLLFLILSHETGCSDLLLLVGCFPNNVKRTVGTWRADTYNVNMFTEEHLLKLRLSNVFISEWDHFLIKRSELRSCFMKYNICFEERKTVKSCNIDSVYKLNGKREAHILWYLEALRHVKT